MDFLKTITDGLRTVGNVLNANRLETAAIASSVATTALGMGIIVAGERRNGSGQIDQSPKARRIRVAGTLVALAGLAAATISTALLIRKIRLA